MNTTPMNHQNETLSDAQRRLDGMEQQWKQLRGFVETDECALQYCFAVLEELRRFGPGAENVNPTECCRTMVAIANDAIRVLKENGFQGGRHEL